MSRALIQRAWFGGAALVAVLAVAACDDSEDGADNVAGKGGDEPGDGGTAGSSSGKGGMPTTGGTMTTDGGVGGTNLGGGGDGGALGGAGSPLGGTGGVEPGGAGAGGDGGGGPTLQERVRAAFVGASPLPAVPADTTNLYADNAAAAELGQRFFFDENFSGALKIDSDLGTTGQVGKVSCKSCHSGAALDDERSAPATVSIGADVHTRNSPSLINSSFYTWTNWGGRFSAQWELPLAVVENGVIMNGNRLALAHRIFDVYKADYEAVFGVLEPAIGTTPARFPASGKPKPAAPDPDGAWEGMAPADQVIVNRILVNYSKALAAYTRKLVSREAPFDLMMAGDDAAMTEPELEGALVFKAKGCGECHGGAHFTDNLFHDLGIPQTGVDHIPAADTGRFKDLPGLINSAFNRDKDYSDDKNTTLLDGLTLPPDVAFTGQFRTPSLRGVTQSGPYMHSGQLATLSDVVDFYKVGGNADTGTGVLESFTISDQEKADLIAFLGTLTGKPVPAALLVDTAAP